MPLVSVIVPNYNHARFLGQRLSSILAQTAGDMEVIVLDDASTDDSLAAIAPFLADPRVRLEVNPQNGGNVFSQWNRGLSLASGPFVWIAESDDFSAPAFLETLLDLLRRHPTAVLAYCQSLAVDAQGVVLGSLLAHTEEIDANRWRGDYFNSGPDERRNYLAILNTIPNVSACLFRREALAVIGGAPTHLALCGDWLTYARLLDHGDIAYTARALNAYRSGENTQRVRSERSGREIIETYLVLGELAARDDIPPRVREHALDRAFRRLRQLAGNPDMDPLALGAMGLMPLALAADPRFRARLAALNARYAAVAEVFHHPSGRFDQSAKGMLNYYAGEWTDLVFTVPSGRLRFDPASMAGLIEIELITVRETGGFRRVLYQAGQGRPFSGLRPVGRCHVLAADRRLVLWSLDDDPGLVLEEPPEGAGEESWTLTVRLRLHTALGPPPPGPFERPGSC